MCLGGEIFKFPLIYSEENYLLHLLVLVKIRQLALVTGASKVRLYKNLFLVIFFILNIEKLVNIGDTVQCDINL